MRESQVDLSNAFRDSYVFEFLNLPEPHNEKDLPSTELNFPINAYCGENFGS